MLKDYDKAEAVSFILGRLYPEDYHVLKADQLQAFLAQCIDADFDYMLSRDILREDGSDGDCFYNSENAFRHIMRELIERNRPHESMVPDLCTLVDDYMDYNRSYLESKGLKYHVDEEIPASLPWG